MGDAELAVDEPDVGLDRREAVLERIEQWPLVLVVVVRVGLRQWRAQLDGCRCGERRAGIQPGDVVLRVGRDEVNSPAELDRALRDARAGDTVMLLVRNARGSQFIAVTPRAESE